MGLPGVMKIAGSAMTPVNARTTSHTRLASVPMLTLERTAIITATSEQREHDRETTRKRDGQNERKETNHPDARVERLQQAALACNLLRHERAAQSSRETNDRRFHESAALHAEYLVARRRSR